MVKTHKYNYVVIVNKYKLLIYCKNNHLQCKCNNNFYIILFSCGLIVKMKHYYKVDSNLDKYKQQIILR